MYNVGGNMTQRKILINKINQMFELETASLQPCFILVEVYPLLAVTSQCWQFDIKCSIDLVGQCPAVNERLDIGVE